MKWRSCPEDSCIWEPFDDKFVVYHRPSGKTHFLNSASYVLLTDVLREPKDFQSILGTFSTAVAKKDAAAYSAQMNSMLRRLEHLGLIERV